MSPGTGKSGPDAGQVLFYSKAVFSQHFLIKGCRGKFLEAQFGTGPDPVTDIRKDAGVFFNISAGCLFICLCHRYLISDLEAAAHKAGILFCCFRDRQ